MSFVFPSALLLLLLVPLLLVAYVIAQHRRRRYVLRYASLSLVRDAVSRGPGIRRHIPPALFLLALATMVVALARPQLTRTTSAQVGSVVLVVDVSGSMQATDVTPTRLEATKNALRTFINGEPRGVKVSLIAFSDRASVVQSPTTDKAQLLRALATLQPELGTNIGDGLQRALTVLQGDLPASRSGGTQAGAQATATPAPQQPMGTVVLLSDGESNTGPPPLQVARAAAAANVKVNTVGIGTAAGTVLHIRGQSILTRLDEATLRGIADATGGAYFGAQDATQLTTIYKHLARGPEPDVKLVDLTGPAVGAALLLSVLGGLLSLFWFNRIP